MIKGCHHTKEARARMSESSRGEKHPMYGKHCSDETKTRISLANSGRKASDIAKKNMSLAQQKRERKVVCISAQELIYKYCVLGLSSSDIAREYKCCCPTIIERLREYNIPVRSGGEAHNMPRYMARLRGWTAGNQAWLGRKHTEETKAKIGNAHRGKVISLEAKRKFRETMTGRRLSDEHIEAMRLGMIERYKDPEERVKTGEATRQAFAKNPDAVRKISEHSKKMWADASWAKKARKALMVGMRIRPNKPETIILALLNTYYPGEWKYTGDGSLIIAGLNPDFANINGKKQLIELWGDYWHKGEDPEDRKRIFKGYGYATLIIWECELKNQEDVSRKIDEFVRVRYQV